MASPLSWFRKHQKGMMVVFGIGAMVIFGLGSVVSMISPGSLNNTYENEKVVEWDGGSLTRGQIDNFRYRHFAASRLIQGLQQAANEKVTSEGKRYITAAIPITPIANQSQFNQEVADRLIASRYQMAQKAAEEGIVVNNQTVNDYLALIANEAGFTQADVEYINHQVNGDQMELVEVLEHLKLELAAQHYQFLAQPELLGRMFLRFPNPPTPTEAAVLYDRLNRKIECDVCPLKVDDFIDKVTETPSNADLRKLFNAGRYRLANTDPDTPGFKQNKRVKVQYLWVNKQDRLEDAMRAVTDEEVQIKYDELVAEENALVMELVPPEEPDEDEDFGEDDETGASDDSNGDEDPAPAPGDDDAPAPPMLEDDESNTESNDDADENSGDETENSSDGEETSDESPDVADDEESDELSDEPETSYRTTNRPQFVSLTQEQNDESEKAAVDGDTDETADEQDDADDQPDSGEASTEMLDDPPADQDDIDSDADDAAPELPDDTVLPGADDDDDQQKPVLTRPKTLDKNLARLIREYMVRSRTYQEIDELVKLATGEVVYEQSDYIAWEALPDHEKKRTERPPIPDVMELADRLGMNGNETELVDYLELREDKNFGAKVGLHNRGREEIAVMVFSGLDERNLFSADIINVEFPDETFVWWLAEKEPTKILDFADAKPLVVEAWKKIKARELAIAEAEKMASAVNASGKTLAATYPSQTHATGAFSWYSQSELTRPIDVEFPDDEFMEQAFGLELNECGVAINETRSHVYVIQKTKNDERDAAAMNEEFLNEWTQFKGMPFEVLQRAEINAREQQRERNRNFEDGLGNRWLAH